MMPGRPGRLIWSRTEKKQKGRVAVAALQGLPSTTDQVLLICANFQVGENTTAWLPPHWLVRRQPANEVAGKCDNSGVDPPKSKFIADLFI